MLLREMRHSHRPLWLVGLVGAVVAFALGGPAGSATGIQPRETARTVLAYSTTVPVQGARVGDTCRHAGKLVAHRGEFAIGGDHVQTEDLTICATTFREGRPGSMSGPRDDGNARRRHCDGYRASKTEQPVRPGREGMDQVTGSRQPTGRWGPRRKHAVIALATTALTIVAYPTTAESARQPSQAAAPVRCAQSAATPRHPRDSTVLSKFLASRQRSVRRVAKNIREARGRPTKAGGMFIRAAADPSAPIDYIGTPGDEAAADAAAAEGYVVSSQIVATDVIPPAYSLASADQAESSRITYFSCGPGFRANLIWYCAPGSSCTTRWYFWFRGPLARTSYCSSVYRYPCQVYASADPPYFDTVMYATVTQSQPGPPTIGDKWCSW